VSLLTLTPVVLVPGGKTPTNLTASLVALGANTGIVWPNSGHEIILISLGTTAATVTSDIGTTVQAQPVTGQSSGALPISTLEVLGPYPSAFNRQDGTFSVELDFSASTNISVVAVQIPGVI
jgi:hypothetical protein